MLKNARLFLKNEKLYVLLAFLLLGVITADKRIPDFESQPLSVSPSVTEFQDAEDRFYRELARFKSLRDFGRAEPEMAIGLFVMTVGFTGLLGFGGFIDLVWFMFPSWRKKWTVEEPDKPGFWKISMLFKTLLLFLTALYSLRMILLFLMLAPAVHGFWDFSRGQGLTWLTENFLALVQATLVDLLCFYFMFYGVRQRGGGLSDLGFKNPSGRFVREVGIGLVAYLGVFPLFFFTVLVLFLIAAIFSYTPPVHPIVTIFLEEEHAPWLIAYSVFLATIVAPVLEEIFFRGFCYPIFKSQWGRGAGMAVSSAMFAAIHGNGFAFFPIFILGMTLAYVYEKRRCLWVPIVLHLTHNLVLILYFFLAKRLVMPH